MKFYNKILYTIGAGLLLGTANLAAADVSARAVMDSAYNYVGSLEKYAFKAVVVDYVQGDEAATRHQNKVCVKVDRPDKLKVYVKGDNKDRTNYINNGLFTMIDHNYNYYGQLKTPKTIDGTLDYIFEKFGIRAPLASLVYSDMQKRAKFTKSKYFGIVDVAGAKCHYVAFGNKRKEVHVWIEAGEKPLVKTFTIIDRNEKDISRADTTINWIEDPKISDSDFIFKAPRGAAKISIEPAN